jgi:DNA-binding SARP family transcriptional activator
MITHYDVLGPLRVFGHDGSVRLPGRRSAIVLCWLILHANDAVGVDTLGLIAWQRSDVGAKVRVLLRSLALTLPSGALYLDGGRARLVVADSAVDAIRFERLVTKAREHLRAGGAARATANLDAALALWRGEPYRELDRTPDAIGEIDRLTELYLGALEDRNGLRLAGEVDYILVAQLRELAVLHPDRLRPQLQLALALYRTDRQIEALDVLRAAMHAGLDAAGGARRLQAAMLNHDPALRRGELPGR